MRKIKNRLITSFRKIKFFGFKIVFWDLLNSLCLKNKMMPGKINQKKHEIILSWLSKNYGYIVKKYKMQHGVISFDGLDIPKYIWICWWDGINAMPPIVKVCYNSVLRYANGFKVTVITKENYGDFLSVPDHILEKVKSGIISITHFSDIIRMSLLGRHGGLWVDATVLFTNDLSLDGLSFFTIRRKFGGKYVPKQRWSGNCIAGSPKIPLFHFMIEIFCEYWKTHTELIDYFLIDYAIAFAYNSVPDIKQLIDDVNLNNENYMAFNRHCHNEYSPQFFKEITKDTAFHKLTWKTNHPIINSKGKTTLYGFILQQNQETIS